MRSKEEAFDYRYFPEPDIPPLDPDPAWVEELRSALPELPRAQRDRYVRDLDLKPVVADVLVGDRVSSALFEETLTLGADARLAANWITQDLAGLRNKGAAVPNLVTARHVADLVALVAADTVSGQGAKQALEDAFTTGDPIAEIVERRGLTQVSDTGALGAIIEQVLTENPEVVEQFRSGKEGVIGFLVGQVMKGSGGSANPKLAQEFLRERLNG
jgi:aspartyl-tRNA(Asn)/glutamyl-tRNA(Gln) amidotransferase subunit B